MSPPSRQSIISGALLAFASQISVNVGAGVAKKLFPVVGAYGVTALRISFAALLLLVLRRPWRRALPTGAWPSLVAYGLMLGLMNVSIYQAFARIPIGIAVGIEVMGPLAIVLGSSRKPIDFVWLVTAVIGLVTLLPLRTDGALDPVGIAFACGAATCWALYIVFGRRVSSTIGSDAVAWGMLVAAGLAAPIGLVALHGVVLAPWVILAALGVAVLSSALPYTFEMEAMRRVPTHAFGVLLSASPAVAAVAAFVVIGERLTLTQWLAIVCIVAASAGAAWTASRRVAVEEVAT